MAYPLHIVIVSWAGRHASARAIAAAVAAEADRLTVVYSHPEGQAPTGAGDWVLLPDDQFFGPKFAAALDRTAPGEAMLLIHADTGFDDWPLLVRRCRAAFAAVPDLALWAPDFTFTPWATDLVTLPSGQIGPDAALVPVVQTDGIITAFCPATLDRLRQFDCAANNLGWGIDWAALAHAYASGRLVLRDTAVRVTHEKGRGYGSKNARSQMLAFFAPLTMAERNQIALLHGYFLRRRAMAGSRLHRAMRALFHADRKQRLAIE